MLSISTIVFIALLTLTVSANPIIVSDNLIRLPFTRRSNATRSAADILKADQARAHAMRTRPQLKAEGGLFRRTVFNLAVENQEVSYTASVGIGEPPTNCES